MSNKFGALLIVVAVGLWLTMPAPQGTDYKYKVKAQQVFDTEKVDTSKTIPFEQAKQKHEVLYKAFKEIETGSFLGGENGAEVYVTTDNETSFYQDWRVVEVDGVHLLVAVSENGTQPENQGEQTLHVIGIIIAAWISLVSLFMPSGGHDPYDYY